MNKAREIIDAYQGPKLRIMEVCGTHTHEIFRLGIRSLLPENIEVISGPGCPVCVTPVDFIDEAIYLAQEHHCTITTFGDLVRVPGTQASLAQARADGAQVKVVYSPLDSVDYAQKHPEEDVVFLSIGFETTTPADLLTIAKAQALGLTNFSLLTANKTMPGAYEAMKDSCDAFLYPGHVHTIIGTGICEKMKEEGVSGVIAGFTAKELLTAIALIVKKSQEGTPYFVNAYPRVVTDEGSPKGQAIIAKYTESVDAMWRGIGVIPGSGLALKDEYAAFDARKKYQVPAMHGHANPACRCGEILRGQIKPYECPLFGKVCTRDHPVGACMVSSEGTCAAYYLYGGQK
ncbi:MAG: hydrogenase formation protein HypD [Intestinibaculum porci]|uniref:hydrogenase formation protein HypD n=1 Tax=Intestinibaculum porci TaxID=2487118 RepID=UPI003F0D7416